MAEYMKDLRERVERINRAQHGGTPVDIRAACQQIIERLRKFEAAYRASTTPWEPPARVEPMPPPTASAPVVVHPKPIEAPPPKRKPGRPRKVQTPAEPGGVA